uniref:Tn3 family transposase n=1 Tax=Paenibacillus kribbensis TaxID=172713 RepID=UPI000B074DE9
MLNDPEQQEKSIKYGDLVANAVIFQNVVDMTTAIRQLRNEGPSSPFYIFFHLLCRFWTYLGLTLVQQPP